MPLPENLAKQIAPDMRAVLDAQWVTMMQERIVLKQLRGQIHDLRQQLDAADHGRKFCDIAASPMSKTTTSNLSTPRSSLASDDMSSCDTHEDPFQQPPELPYLCRLPSRLFVNENTKFSWVKPPEHWPVRERALFLKVRQSSAYRRLWLASAMVNNFYTWSGVSPQDFRAFYDEANALHTLLPQCQLLRCRLTGGLEDFVTDVLRADLAIGTSALTTPPEMSFVSMSPYCIPFGASPLSLTDLLHPETKSCNVFLRPDGVPKSKLITTLETIDRKLKYPLPAGAQPFLVFALYNRAHCRVFNQWVSGYEQSNRVHVCAAWHTLKVRSMEHAMRPQWLALRGPWELILVQQGKDPLGVSISPHKYAAALQQLCKTQASMNVPEEHRSNRASCWYPLPSDVRRPQHHLTKLKQFWSEWEKLAEKRRLLLSKKRMTRADWHTLDQNYQTTNAMLVDCPEPRLSRAARLAKIDVHRSLLTPSCSTYAILGKFPTYVGQVGAKARKRRRPFMDRLKGHFSRAKSLKAMYMGSTQRRWKKTPFFGNIPSLPRLLAMHGTHQVTMRPMEDAPPGKLDSAEYKLERLLSPCCNAIQSYAGTQRVDWLLAGAFNLETVGCLRQLAAEIMTCKNLKSKYSVPQLLTILLECRRPMRPQPFRALSLKVQLHLMATYGIYIPDRIPVRVPIPDRSLLLLLRTEFAKMLTQCRLPSPLTAWLVSCLSILPQKTKKVHQVLRGARPQVVVNHVTELLSSKSGDLVCLSGLQLGKLLRSTLESIRSQITQLQCTESMNRRCHCHELKQDLRVPCGDKQQHVVFRSPDQWRALLRDSNPCTQNARNATLPSTESLQTGLHIFRTSIEPIARTKHPDMPETGTSLPETFESLYAFTESTAVQYIQEHARLAAHTDVNTLHTVNDSLKGWSVTVSHAVG